ncbi:MAG: hypothetical protein HQL24_00995 [Candidatus Omnitrophica bacterium]|nr:hypothetical protein [Candidatus Omnitrophota bacterium]
MKKLFVLMMMLGFVSSVCFAQQAATTAPKQEAPALEVVKPEVPIAPKPAVQIEVKTVVGKIEAVTLPDFAKKVKAQIALVQDNGEKMNLIVAVSAMMFDSEGKEIGIDKLKKDDKIEVKYYVSTSGANKATSIKVLK